MNEILTIYKPTAVSGHQIRATLLRAFAVAAPKLWNTIPRDTREAESVIVLNDNYRLTFLDKLIVTLSENLDTLSIEESSSVFF